MKKLKHYINRPNSIIKDKELLEELYVFKDFPVYMGCVDALEKDDVVADMSWKIGKETGIIQLDKLLPHDVLYLRQHNDGVGQVWREHYKAFAKLLSKYAANSILEIGGAHDYIANFYREFGGAASWTIVEPNPEHINNPDIKVIQAWFDDSFSIEMPVDMVVHSHVFEHAYDPLIFMQHIGKFLKPGDKHIFTFPNMVPMLENKFANCLNFEHTVLLTEEITEYILLKAGFRILEKEYYGSPHSIFYVTERVSTLEILPTIKDEYIRNKKLFQEYVQYYKDIIKDLNEKIDNTSEPVYLFGGHIFSQMLTEFGLKADGIESVLDNSKLKQGKRLYGTGLFVESPEVLKDKGPVNIILKAGIYNDEIRKDVLENINSKAVFW